MVQKDNRKGWLPGVIHGKCDEPRSYVVQTPNCSVVRRNRRFLSEISPNAARKFNFRQENPELIYEPAVVASSKTDIGDRNSKTSKASKQVHFDTETSKPQRVELPVTANVPRRSTHEGTKPLRLIEQCAVLLT